MHNRDDLVLELFPPGTRVTLSINDTPARGTVRNIPMVGSPLIQSAASPPSTAAPTLNYVISLDNGTTTECSFEDLIAVGRDSNALTDSAPPTANPFATLPQIFQRNSKVTFDHNGAFHKGFLQHSNKHIFQFQVRRNIRSTKVDWSVPLSNFKQHWTTLVGDDILFPVHTTVSSFLKSATANTAPSANFVSANNFLSPCPRSLSKALHPLNPDRQVWLDSYREEKGGLEIWTCMTRSARNNTSSSAEKDSFPSRFPQCVC